MSKAEALIKEREMLLVSLEEEEKAMQAIQARIRNDRRRLDEVNRKLAQLSSRPAPAAAPQRRSDTTRTVRADPHTGALTVTTSVPSGARDPRTRDPRPRAERPAARTPPAPAAAAPADDDDDPFKARERKKLQMQARQARQPQQQQRQRQQPRKGKDTAPAPCVCASHTPSLSTCVCVCSLLCARRSKSASR